MKSNVNPLAKLSAGAAGLLLLLAILVAVNLIAANLRLRVDLTADRLYSLSAGSRAVLAKLPQEVTLKFYFSRSAAEVPMFIKSYARQVEDLLKEYELAGGGRLVVEHFDPQPDSDDEEWAERYGIQPQPTGMMSPPMYFGLVAVAGDREALLPALSPRNETMLEYEITRLITRVTHAAKPVIGVLSPLPVLGQPSPQMMMMPQRNAPQPWVAFSELQRDFDLRNVPVDATQIDPDIATLVLVHPRDLAETTLYAIDQFVIRGGRLVVFVDPFSVTELEAGGQSQMAMMGMGGGQGPSTLGKLFDAWGVGFDTGKIVADERAMTRLGGGGRVEQSPIFLSLTANNMNRTDLLTAQLEQVMLPFAGELTDKTSEAIDFTPLITSSDAACAVDAMAAQFGTQAVRAQLKPDGLKHVLAARLSGKFASAFPQGAPAPAAQSDQPAPPPAAPHRAASETPNQILIFTDADFLADRFSVESLDGLFGAQVMQPRGDNLALCANAVEQMSGNADLIAIRARGRSSRPFTRVDELEFKAMRAWQAEEERLKAELENTRGQLARLQTEKTASQKYILSPEQESAVREFQRTERETKAKLKQVSKNLRREIDTLGAYLKAVNIAAVPLLVIGFGLVRGAARRRRQG